MKDFRYVLEGSRGKDSKRIYAKGNTKQVRHTCPNCGQRRFTRVVDTVTSEYLASEYGRCSRLNTCRYERYIKNETATGKPDLPPQTDSVHVTKGGIEIQFAFNPQVFRMLTKSAFKKQGRLWVGAVTGANAEIAIKLVQSYNFTLNEQKIVYKTMLPEFTNPVKYTDKLSAYLMQNYAGIESTLRLYGVTCSGDNTVFMYQDDHGIRAIKSMRYKATGRRDRDYNNAIRTDGTDACFFGQHLIHINSNPICIVESEKTAILSHYFYPSYTWIATGGSNGLRIERIHEISQYLHGRTVYLYPDADDAGRDAFMKAFYLIENHAKDYNYRVLYRDLLPDSDDGEDLADIITAHPPKRGAEIVPDVPAQPVALAPVIESTSFLTSFSALKMESEYEKLANDFEAGAIKQGLPADNISGFQMNTDTILCPVCVGIIPIHAAKCFICGANVKTVLMQHNWAW